MELRFRALVARTTAILCGLHHRLGTQQVLFRQRPSTAPWVFKIQNAYIAGISLILNGSFISTVLY
jgi:hypothetical protein